MVNGLRMKLSNAEGGYVDMLMLPYFKDVNE